MPDATADFMRWSNHPIFVRMARAHYESFKTAVTASEQIESRVCNSAEEASLRSHENEGNRETIMTSGLSVIVFAGCAVEAIIYDYGARRLSDSFFDNHVDRLEAASKWVLTTQLVTGKVFPVADNAYCLLKRLIAARNKIVHSKSSAMTQEPAEDLAARKQWLMTSVHEAIRALDALSELAKAIDPDDVAFAEGLK